MQKVDLAEYHAEVDKAPTPQVQLVPGAAAASTPPPKKTRMDDDIQTSLSYSPTEVATPSPAKSKASASSQMTWSDSFMPDERASFEEYEPTSFKE